MSLSPYPKYKPSGVEWLGDVPTHWGVTRLKIHVDNVVAQTNEKTDGEAYIALEHVESWTGKIREANSSVQFDSQVKCFRAEDVLFGKLRPYLAKVTRPSVSGVCVGEFLVLRPHGGDLTPNYLEQLIRAKPIIDLIAASTFGAKMPRADWEFIGGLKYPLPPLFEQVAIADFLDRETEKIDTLVAKKRTLIERLKEERTALITHTVTRGLPPEAARAAGFEPHPKLKSSGVEWLGEVPAHWEVISLKWLATTASGDGISAEDITSECNQTYSIPVMGGNGLMGYTEKCNTTSQILVIGRVGALCGNVHVVSTPVWVTDNALILTLNKNILNLRYLMSVLHARNLNEIADKTAQPLITGTKIRAESVPVPPTSEQTAIANFLDRKIAKIDELTAKIGAAIERLQEYRSALITAAVTGKIDVREEAAL